MRGSSTSRAIWAAAFPGQGAAGGGDGGALLRRAPARWTGSNATWGRTTPNLLTCDLVCHGVPSPAVFRAYLDGLEAARGSKVVSVRFKDKSHGWSHPWFTAQFADGSVYTEDFNRTGYGRGFGMQLFLRPACARCRYTSTSRPADFTLADYWGLDEKLALPVERDKGVSMVLVNSARGQAVFDALSPGSARWSAPWPRRWRATPAGLPPEGQPPPGRLLRRLRCPALRRGGKALSGPPLPALPGGGQDAHPGHEGKNPQAAEITAAKCLQFIREFFPAVWYTTLYVTTGRAFRPTGGNFT